ncbi:class I SAM-dependent methyltransferase [Streptomyces sp. NPDC046866]|uniref:SAM-dependent methyltransferase n=1 Tax=Streptomyces sp. NPDC046866 TaxID=3154921 RepID=UPI0034538DE8
MERSLISTLAHVDHPIAAPLFDGSVRTLLDRALPRGDERVLDLGCAEAAWLLSALAGRPGLRADGVDVNASALAKGRAAADAAGLGDRLTLHTGDATAFEAPQPYDLVLCVGATHAFGGLLPALEAARGHLAPGGSVLVGDGFWERKPGPETLAAGFEADEYTDLATTVERISAAGWTPVYGHVSTLAEWDAYEWSWTGSLSRWALEHPDHPDAAEALDIARTHRNEWLRGYRGTLGFVTLQVRATASW